MKKIGLECPKAEIAQSMDDAFAIQAKVGFPCIIRPSFTMGGSGVALLITVRSLLRFVSVGLTYHPPTSCSLMRV